MCNKSMFNTPNWCLNMQSYDLNWGGVVVPSCNMHGHSIQRSQSDPSSWQPDEIWSGTDRPTIHVQLYPAQKNNTFPSSDYKQGPGVRRGRSELNIFQPPLTLGPVCFPWATCATKWILRAWSTKWSLFAKPFHKWVQLCAKNLTTVINRWLAIVML